MEELELTRVELSERLGVSVGTLRKWEGEFSQWIETPPGVKGFGQPRVFSQHDVLVFATVAKARKEGKRIGDIRAELDERLASSQPGDIPGEPDIQEPARVQLALYIDTIRQLEATEGELVATRSERDYLRNRLQELEDKLIDAERRASSAETLAGKPPTFWQRLFGSGKE